MQRVMNTRVLEKHLIERGLVPDGCRLVEVSITPNSLLIIRYEVFIGAERLALVADAMKAAADETLSIEPEKRKATPDA